MPFRPIAAVGVLAVACALSGSVVPASAASVAQPYDFFGDNHPDLVVGVPRLPVGPQLQAGGLFVLPASASGLSLTRQVLTQETADVPGEAESANHFGSTFASADFDHDGYADLAVGVPDKDLGQVENTGSVVILFGSETGLTGTRSYALSRTGGARGDKFGTAVVASDFNKDGWADLAIGAPGADAVHVDGEGEDAYASGSVTLLRGGPGGFANARSTVLHGRRTGPKHDLSFGSALAAGDLAGNRSVDLAVAAEGYAFSDGAGYRGSVSGCFSGSALPTSCTQLQSGNRYAGLSALAVGNVEAGSRSEIVVGVPNPDAEVANAGSVHTLALSGAGATLRVKESVLTQATKGVPGSNTAGDEFGADLVLGDLGHDGYADLVIGAPGEAVNGHYGAGRVTVVHGGKKGYRTSGNKTYDQASLGIPGVPESLDRFGAAVGLLDRDADGHLDLAIGAPGENDTGAVTVLAGSGKSFTTRAARTFGLQSLGQPPASDAEFGSVLNR